MALGSTSEAEYVKEWAAWQKARETIVSVIQGKLADARITSAVPIAFTEEGDPYQLSLSLEWTRQAEPEPSRESMRKAAGVAQAALTALGASASLSQAPLEEAESCKPHDATQRITMAILQELDYEFDSAMFDISHDRYRHTLRLPDGFPVLEEMTENL